MEMYTHSDLSLTHIYIFFSYIYYISYIVQLKILNGGHRARSYWFWDRPQEVIGLGTSGGHLYGLGFRRSITYTVAVIFSKRPSLLVPRRIRPRPRVRINLTWETTDMATLS